MVCYWDKVHVQPKLFYIIGWKKKVFCHCMVISNIVVTYGKNIFLCRVWMPCLF